MSIQEFNNWIKYKNENGSLNIGKRLEDSLSFVSLLQAKNMGNKTLKRQDFLTYYVEERNESFEAIKKFAKDNGVK